MKNKINLIVVTPYGKILEESVDEVNAPAIKGEFGVLPGHTYFLTILSSGTLWYRQGNCIKYLSVNGGYAEVSPDSVTILADYVNKKE